MSIKKVKLFGNNQRKIVDLNLDYKREARYRTSEPQKIEMKEGQELQVIAATNDYAIFKKNNHGFQLYLKNPTKDSLNFSAQDGSLYMAMEAQDEKGTWKTIEYITPSWCGNSYHQVTLAPSHQWTFVVPKYEGTFKTKLRFCFTAERELEMENKKERKYYSNEFDGSVNLTQFWKKEHE
jgi:hypothetical protein